VITPWRQGDYSCFSEQVFILIIYLKYRVKLAFQFTHDETRKVYRVGIIYYQTFFIMEINIQNLVTKSFGGSGGDTFTQRGIETLAIRHGSYVDAIIIDGQQFGGNGGELSNTITFASNEYISRMEIRQGSYIDYIEITTNLGQQITGGGNGGNPVTLTGEIIALGGRSGSYIDQLEILGNFN